MLQHVGSVILATANFLALFSGAGPNANHRPVPPFKPLTSKAPMNTSKEVLDKIRKLLRLSTSSNQHEAELALKRAQELAVRHYIDIASVVVNDEPRPLEKYESQKFEGKRSLHTKFIHSLLVKHFKVAIVYEPGRGLVHYIGKTEDIEFGRWVYEFLDREFTQLWKQFREDNGAPQTERSTYLFGLYRGLDAKLTQARNSAENQKFKEIASEQGIERADVVAKRYALALRDHKVALGQATAEFFPNLRKARGSRVRLRDEAVFAGGQQDGRKINIARPVAGRRSAAMLE